jgi:hypothetical protein
MFLAALVALVAMFSLPLDSQAETEAGTGGAVMELQGEHSPIWKLKATKPFLIGGYGDNFNYDGSRVSPMLGKAKVVLDSVKNSGAIVVHVKGTINPEKGKTYTGDIKIYYAVKKGGPAFQEGGVADFIYMHGDTGQGPPVMPKVRTYLAAWGSADVYVNGELVYEGLHGHIMYTERSRDVASKAIYNRDKSGFYDPQKPADFSIAAPHETELHITAHSMEADKGNFPPNAVWIHLNFEKAVDKSYGKHGFRGGAPCGPGCGCGCVQGGPCSCGAQVKCGAGCGCGCNQGGPCAMAGGNCGSGCGCGCAQGHPCSMSGTCTGICNCGCQQGAPCRAVDGKCGGGCGCGCAAGGPCSMTGSGYAAVCGCGCGMAGGPCGPPAGGLNPGCGCGAGSRAPCAVR